MAYHFLKFRLTGFQLREFDCTSTVDWQECMDNEKRKLILYNTLIKFIIVSTSVSIQRISPRTELLSNNMYSIQCTIDTLPNATDIDGTDVTATLENNAYVTSITVSAVLGDDLTATCNWNVNGGMFTDTTTAQGTLLTPAKDCLPHKITANTRDFLVEVKAY